MTQKIKIIIQIITSDRKFEFPSARIRIALEFAPVLALHSSETQLTCVSLVTRFVILASRELRAESRVSKASRAPRLELEDWQAARLGLDTIMASNFELRASSRLSTLDCLHSSLQIEFDWPAQVRQPAEQQRDEEQEQELEQELEEKQELELEEKRERRKEREKKRNAKEKRKVN